MKRILVLSAVALALVTAVLSGLAGTAGGTTKIVGNDLWNVGSFPVAGPDFTAAADFPKHYVLIHGVGSFDPATNSATGGGGFLIHTPYANFSGSWRATGLISFVSYGPGHGPSGGKMRMRVSLSGFGSGVLTVTCLVGSPPPGAVEGSTLVLNNGLNFSIPLDGETVFDLP